MTAFEAPRIGDLPSGPRDSITDVGRITVGHATLAQDEVQTGVTLVRPHAGNLFTQKLAAAAAIFNGFGKTMGLTQLNELGTLETPIALTTTFAVGTIATAMFRATCEENPGVGRMTTTVNPVVAECHDGWLNDVQRFAIAESHYTQALADASTEFAQGAVGAGRGMSCFELKGGIGTSSRVAPAGDAHFSVGALVLANFGRLPQLTVAGRRIGPLLLTRLRDAPPAMPERGSIIVVLATDAPLDHRQLRRVAARAAAGIARTGSHYGHVSGDLAIAFSTSKTIAHEPVATITREDSYAEPRIDALFNAAAEATEQAIVNALFAAETVTGFAGHTRVCLRELAPDWKALLA